MVPKDPCAAGRSGGSMAALALGWRVQRTSRSHRIEDVSAVQAPDVETRHKALQLDRDERREASYRDFLASIVAPVAEARAALHEAAAERTCREWASAHHDALARAAEELRRSHPPEWLAVYRNSFLKAIDLFIQAADGWLSDDAAGADDCAERAAEALDGAEDLADGLI